MPNDGKIHLFFSLELMPKLKMTLFRRIDDIHSLSRREIRLKLLIKQIGKPAPILNRFPFIRINPDSDNQSQG
jgi:hypothetical protein